MPVGSEDAACRSKIGVHDQGPNIRPEWNTETPWERHPRAKSMNKQNFAKFSQEFHTPVAAADACCWVNAGARSF